MSRMTLIYKFDKEHFNVDTLFRFTANIIIIEVSDSKLMWHLDIVNI